MPKSKAKPTAKRKRKIRKAAELANNPYYIRCETLERTVGDLRAQLEQRKSCLVGILSPEQKDVARAIGCDEAGYAWQYLMLLYRSRHIIEEVRRVIP